MESKAKRLMSLDVARGITIMGMIIVNNPGNTDFVYSQLMPEQWNGIHLADLGVPVFLFIVGISLVYSFEKRMARGEKESDLFKKIFYRFAVIYLIGFAIDAFPFVELAPFRVLNILTVGNLAGTLQRIAISYLFASVIYIKFRKIIYLAGWVIVLVCIYQYILIKIQLPVDYVPSFKDTFEWEALLFGEAISATAIVLLGTLTGILLKSRYTLEKKARILCASGFAFIVAGLLIGYFWPINKMLLSVPFGMIATGISLAVFSGLFWIIEIKDKHQWAYPFKIFGRNSILVFAGSILFGTMAKVGLNNFISLPEGSGNENFMNIIFYYLHLVIPSPYMASLLYAVLIMLFWLAVMRELYKREIFIKI